MSCNLFFYFSFLNIYAGLNNTILSTPSSSKPKSPNRLKFRKHKIEEFQRQQTILNLFEVFHFIEQEPVGMWVFNFY